MGLQFNAAVSTQRVQHAAPIDPTNLGLAVRIRFYPTTLAAADKVLFHIERNGGTAGLAVGIDSSQKLYAERYIDGVLQRATLSAGPTIATSQTYEAFVNFRGDAEAGLGISMACGRVNTDTTLALTAFNGTVGTTNDSLAGSTWDIANRSATIGRLAAQAVFMEVSAWTAPLSVAPLSNADINFLYNNGTGRASAWLKPANTTTTLQLSDSCIQGYTFNSRTNTAGTKEGTPGTVGGAAAYNNVPTTGGSGSPIPSDITIADTTSLQALFDMRYSGEEIVGDANNRSVALRDLSGKAAHIGNTTSSIYWPAITRNQPDSATGGVPKAIAFDGVGTANVQLLTNSGETPSYNMGAVTVALAFAKWNTRTAAQLVSFGGGQLTISMQAGGYLRVVVNAGGTTVTSTTRRPYACFHKLVVAIDGGAGAVAHNATIWVGDEAPEVLSLGTYTATSQPLSSVGSSSNDDGCAISIQQMRIYTKAWLQADVDQFANEINTDFGIAKTYTATVLASGSSIMCGDRYTRANKHWGFWVATARPQWRIFNFARFNSGQTVQGVKTTGAGAGTFVYGETVTESTSGFTGKFVGISDTAAFMGVKELVGGALGGAAGRTLTGGTSGATRTTAAGSTSILGGAVPGINNCEAAAEVWHDEVIANYGNPGRVCFLTDLDTNPLATTIDYRVIVDGCKNVLARAFNAKPARCVYSAVLGTTVTRGAGGGGANFPTVGPLLRTAMQEATWPCRVVIADCTRDNVLGNWVNGNGVAKYFNPLADGIHPGDFGQWSMSQYYLLAMDDALDHRQSIRQRARNRT